MYFKFKSNVIFRRYDSFGYITDNRNFGYKLSDDDSADIGDKVVSESGAVFLSVLSRKPQSLEVLTRRICQQFVDVGFDVLKKDAEEFYSELAHDGFVAVGETFNECEEGDYKFSYKSAIPNKKDFRNFHKDFGVSTQDFFDKYFDGIPNLTSVHIEITSRCNERCRHCYIPHEKKINSMSLSLFYKILKQINDMNLLHVTVSGGEPMLHKHLIEILRELNKANFSVNLLSNLTLLDEAILAEMKNNPLLSVQTTLYSMNPDIHDSITQVKGSFVKTQESILKLLAADIPMQISCPIMKQNLICYSDVVDWAQKFKIGVNSDYVIIGQYDHSIKNLNCRLTLDDIQSLISDEFNSGDEMYWKKFEHKLSERKKMELDDFVCSVCNSSICVSEDGNVYPCAGWQDYVVGNVNEMGLKDIWRYSDKINYLRNLRRKDFKKCITCLEKEFCTMCMVRNANEHPLGNPLEVNPYFCNIAKTIKNLYLIHSKSVK